VAPYQRYSKGDSVLLRFGLTNDQAVVHQVAGMCQPAATAVSVTP
jgi:hypothetical protein